MPIPMTKKGLDALRVELERLKKVERPKVIQDIAEARSHGDLSENAEYDAAKDRQGFIEARIRDLEHKIANAQIIEASQLSAEKVTFGATVILLDLESKEKRQYTLVGQEESDLKNGKISVQSPVGRALVGRKAGDSVEVTTPARLIEYEILEVRIDEI
ncbi:MAG: transcription elongation factor GreA [Deltaproteobacteria bacterium]|nr:transcription elongation factor GreA [Deltaproteobacteria bacterium]